MFIGLKVFDARYNGYSTDELFFVSGPSLYYGLLIHTYLIQFNHEWGGRPWDDEAQEVIAKYVTSQLSCFL